MTTNHRGPDRNSGGNAVAVEAQLNNLALPVQRTAALCDFVQWVEHDTLGGHARNALFLVQLLDQVSADDAPRLTGQELREALHDIARRLSAIVALTADVPAPADVTDQANALELRSLRAFSLARMKAGL